MDRDRDFAIGAVGLVPTEAPVAEADPHELQSPLGPGKVIRLVCECGVVAELDAESLKRLALGEDHKGGTGEYVSVKTCPVCTGKVTEPVFLPIP